MRDRPSRDAQKGALRILARAALDQLRETKQERRQGNAG